MGNSGPHTSKSSDTGESLELGLKWGLSGMQGWRASMEDAHFAIPELSGAGWAGTAAFGVLDGHGGADVAQYSASVLPQIIGAQPSHDPQNALLAAFFKTDERMRDVPGLDSDNQGCTANVCLVSKEHIVVANAGDSRAVLCRGGRSVPLSEDHKPSLRRERDRIARAGGVVVDTGDMGGPRVMGDLNLSRSLGDFRHKQDLSLNAAEQIITCKPDINTFYRQPNDEFMLLACDGVWDVLSSEDAVEFIRSRIGATLTDSDSITEVVEELLDACLSPDLRSTRGLGGDNMTAVLIVFNNQGVTWGMRHIAGALGCYSFSQ